MLTYNQETENHLKIEGLLWHMISYNSLFQYIRPYSFTRILVESLIVISYILGEKGRMLKKQVYTWGQRKNAIDAIIGWLKCQKKMGKLKKT